MPNGKCGAWNTCFYFVVGLFYSTDQSSSLDAIFYSIGLRGVYVDGGLKDNTGLFYSYDTGKNANKRYFCSNPPYAWASIVFHCLCEIIIQNWIRFNWSKHIRPRLEYSVVKNLFGVTRQSVPDISPAFTLHYVITFMIVATVTSEATARCYGYLWSWARSLQTKLRKQRTVFYSVEELFDTGCITVVRYSKGLNMKIRTRRILVMIVVILMVTDLFSEHIKCNLFLPVLLFNKPRFNLGPVHKFPDIFESATKYLISFRIQLPSTCIGWMWIFLNPFSRSENDKSATNPVTCTRENFWIRKEKVVDSKVSEYVWKGPKSTSRSKLYLSPLHRHLENVKKRTLLRYSLSITESDSE